MVRSRLAVALMLFVMAAPAAGSTATSTKTPTFAPPKHYKTFKATYAVAVGDLNGDRMLDIAAGNLGGAGQGSPGATSVLINKGGGTFQASRNYLADKAYDVNIVDLNGDHRADVAALGGESSSAMVFINKGDGTLAREEYYPVGDQEHNPRSLTAGDLTGDGRAEVVSVNLNGLLGPGTASVLVNRGDGTFDERVLYETKGGSDPLAGAIADLNGDGRGDLAVANDARPGSNGTVSVFISRANGTLQAPRLYGAGDRPWMVALGDVNRDRRLDIVTPNLRGNSVSVLLNQGNGTFRPKRDFRTSTACRLKACVPDSVAIADLNRDGAVDLAVMGQQLTVLLGRGDGSFATRRDYKVRGGAIRAGDLNGDGKPDLAIVGGGGIDVLLNRTR
jgi:FG-GAP-like repeat